MQPLSTYIQHSELIDAQAVEELWQLVDRHPTFQTARLLLVRGLYQLQDERFGEALRQAALFIPDRAQLFDMIEGEKFRFAPRTSKPRQQIVEEPSVDRTQSLIDSFLSDRPEDTHQRRPRVADASVDYMTYLEQLDDAPRTESSKDVAVHASGVDAPEKTGRVSTFVSEEEISQDDGDLDEDLLEASDEDTISSSQERVDDESKVNQSIPSEDYFTETLARIYIKQCKYDKAIEIIRRLSLNYPKKSRYFADQIRFLGKLILNEQCKNEEK